jgi:hypothetical protein
VVITQIIPLEDEDQTENQEIKLEETGSEGILKVISDETGRKRDKGDKKKTNRIQEQKILVNVMDPGKLLMMPHPECSKDTKTL